MTIPSVTSDIVNVDLFIFLLVLQEAASQVHVGRHISGPRFLHWIYQDEIVFSTGFMPFILCEAKKAG